MSITSPDQSLQRKPTNLKSPKRLRSPAPQACFVTETIVSFTCRESPENALRIKETEVLDSQA